MNRTSLILAVLLLSAGARAQKIYYSEPESKDFSRFRFDVIAHHDDRIIVYKAVYYGSPNGNTQEPSSSYSNPSPALVGTGPTTSIMESSIYIYDPSMKLIATNRLSVPKEISGVHFLVYGDFFYMFYQYQAVHTIYCMAARIGMDGKMIGAPRELDHTDVLDIHYQSQIYSVIYSEDKKHIVVFSEDASSEKQNTVHSMLFDQDLRLVRKSAHNLSMEGSEYLSEFKVDNDGNFVFLGLSESRETDNAHRSILFTLGAKDDSLTWRYYVPSELFVDDPRLLIDNNHKRYIVLSFYSLASEGDMEGFFCDIQDAGGGEVAATKTVLSDSIRRQIKTKGGVKKVFDEFYLQDLHLRKDGGFGLEAENLYSPFIGSTLNRWNYLQYISEQVATNFVFYDPYEYNHYFPWKSLRSSGPGLALSSEKTMVLSFNPDGIIEWVNVVNTPQIDRFHSTLGYKSFVVHDLIYLLYNVSIRNKNYLTAQSISSSGQVNTDPRLKEDVGIKDVNSEYYYYPRYARVVGSGELIVPCRKGAMISLARLEF